MKVPREWNNDSYYKFQQDLLLLQDKTYQEFNFKIVYTDYKKIGIRTPILKDIAKKILKGDAISFLEVVKDDYYEEVMLEGIVISLLKDIDDCLYYFNRYLEKIDNWAFCDITVSGMKIVKDYKAVFWKRIKKYLKSKNEYIVRIGLIFLLNYYVEDKYISKIFKFCNGIKVDTYYVNMAISWLVSECFFYDKAKTILFLKQNKLNKFTQNKTIDKIHDSSRVSSPDKIAVLQFRR